MRIPLAIVIPVYNEGENILPTLNSIKEKVKTPHQIYIVYDFEEDTTVPIVKNLPNIKLLKNKYGRGALNAIKSGLEEANGEAVLVTMGDMSDDYSIVDEMYKRIENGAGIVCGSRYMKGGKQIGGPPLKTFLSRMAGISLRFLSRIPTHDISNSFKMYAKQVLNDIKIESTGGFEIGMEITVKAHLKKYKIEEIPTTWTDRAEGKSNFKLAKWLPKYLYWYFYLLLRKVS